MSVPRIEIVSAQQENPGLLGGVWKWTKRFAMLFGLYTLGKHLGAGRLMEHVWKNTAHENAQKFVSETWNGPWSRNARTGIEGVYNYLHNRTHNVLDPARYAAAPGAPGA